MPRHPELYQWIDTIAMHFPSLSKPEALGLALWSFGMVVARSCSLTAVADVLSPLLGQKYNTLRERLRFWGNRQFGQVGERVDQAVGDGSEEKARRYACQHKDDGQPRRNAVGLFAFRT
ncbi:hypothetical protein [Methylovulum psychrotolerans]|uniref:Uncharacterized protein n=1 Tax=Methylovulum psychrotolerans TaxID=1704499 RepID=A0A1Z4C280_9GAMM|nr:hypothetical protein [Methylovulum psychrotolerans]ASF47609.1 hypothetical protein CEK71_16915 [Methylovulum psychrotolerans]